MCFLEAKEAMALGFLFASYVLAQMYPTNAVYCFGSGDIINSCNLSTSTAYCFKIRQLTYTEHSHSTKIIIDKPYANINDGQI